MDSITSISSLHPICSEIIMALMVMGLLILGVVKGDNSAKLLSGLAIAGLLFIIFSLLKSPITDTTILNDMFILDVFARNIKIITAIGLIVSYLLSIKYLYDTGFVKFEYPILLLIAGLGMFLMVSSHHLLSLYMALELQSLSLYILAAFNRNSAKSAEAGVKYFILGAISSGLILFGISLLYGFTGVLEYGALADSIASLDGVEKTGAVFGMIFLISGIAFKMSVAPFHMWTPDVYDGAPMPVTLFFAIVPKLVALAILLRLLMGPFEMLVDDWQMVIMFLSVMSMVWAAFAGLVQKNVKRLMAYSSIGNMGYALLGVAVVTVEGVSASLFYLILYMVMVAGVFGVFLSMQRDGVALRQIEDLSGLSQYHPIRAYALAVLMFSLSGIPPLSGFFGKLIVFQEVVAQGYYVLAVIGVVTSVIAAYYYLRIIKVMFFDEADVPFDRKFGVLRAGVVFCSVLFALIYVIRPDFMLSYTRDMASDLMGSGIERSTFVSAPETSEETVLQSVQDFMSNDTKLDY